ncbi:hypothetical protein [Flavobacterium coralii]|uniref:hypothetical protein n=1 Tax=Flavobacterium coralii TaxID=2838017 RepID=UPI000C3D4960|nr:hypothetical protein [Flavobacterium sp.]|tara:strand:- start:95732 stop:96697 length:966 start_codon:yes stop_codon:yes gene_type:complete
MENSISQNNLKDADILLYHGTSFLSRAIRFFDGSNYNHASLYVGDREVVEAIATGVKRRNVDVSIANYSPVSVFRLVNRPNDVSPVLNVVPNYEGDRYAYEQLLLLVFICTFRRVRANNFFMRFLKRLLEKAAGILLQYTNGDKNALICSEFVYRCYNEAVAGMNPYAIELSDDYISSLKNIGSVDENSVFAALYLKSNNLFGRAIVESPVLEMNNIKRFEGLADVNNFKDGVLVTDDLESLFEEVVESYQREDYLLDRFEVASVKERMDMFVAANLNMKSDLYRKESANGVLDFLKANANFVTPGDLFRAKNLIRLGDLK